MKNEELLYDHYKETCDLNKQAQKERDRFFLFSALLLFALLFLAFFPTDTEKMLYTWFEDSFSVKIQYPFDLIQTIVWCALYFYFTKYAQRTVYVERAYGYTKTLEEQLDIQREIKSYNSDYPRVLSIVDASYKWVFPILFLVLVVLKIVLEWIHACSSGFETFLLICTCINTAFCLVICSEIVCLMLFYHSVQ